MGEYLSDKRLLDLLICLLSTTTIWNKINIYEYLEMPRPFAVFGIMLEFDVNNYYALQLLKICYYVR